MKRFASLVAFSVLLVGGSAQADPSWTYVWTPGASSVVADTPGTGGVNFTAEGTTAAPLGANGNSDIVATNLRVFSTAPAATPDSIIKGGNYALSLTLTDSSSGQTGSVTFTGKLTGTISAFNSNLTNGFTSATTQTLLLGGNLYSITIGPYSPPGPPTATNAGSIAAFVSVQAGNGTIAQTPEPTSLVLSCFGLAFLGAASWRKRRPVLAA